MNEDQLRLMAQVLIGFVAGSDWLVLYSSFGANVGQCRYCGVFGEVKYPDILYKHKETCTIFLCEQLDKSLQSDNERQ